MAERARGAVFLDRDNTLVEDPGYLHDPALVRLLPGVRDGLQDLSRAGWPLVLVSNQSGIARGLFGPEAFAAVNQRLEEVAGLRFAGAYFCPHHPAFTGPCECRKPGLVLFRRAAADLGLDLARSWYVGNRGGDALPASALGGHGVLLTPHARPEDVAAVTAAGLATAADFRQVVSAILAQVP